MLPGLRVLAAAISFTILLVVLGFGQLVKLQVAQTGSATLPTPESRFAGLPFTERADWTPDRTSHRISLEQLAPFATHGGPSHSAGPPPD